jgi:DNA-binding beta-propeller fold protein YncE
MRGLIAGGCLVMVAIVGALLAESAAAGGTRGLLLEAALGTKFCARCPQPNPEPPQPTTPPLEGQIEGPCGIAFSPSGEILVADYYQRVIDIFASELTSSPEIWKPPRPYFPYRSQFRLPGANPVFGTNTLDSVCGLAFDAAGNLYAEELHEGVLRYNGTWKRIVEGNSTGVAVDPTTERLYVNDRTYIGEYALPASPGDAPLKKLATSLIDGFGLAAFEGTVYAADAASGTVKAFRPEEANPDQPATTIDYGFTSLTDSSLAVDPTNGHLLVIDNAQPGYLHPQSSVYEFESFAGGNGFLGLLPGAPVFGAPSGIAVSPSGQVLVTDGNGELSNVFQYGSYGSSIALTGPQQESFQLSGAVVAREITTQPAGPVSGGRPDGTDHKSLKRKKRRKHHRHHKNPSRARFVDR